MIKSIFFFTFILSLTGTLSAATYYIDSEAGNDGHSGTSTSSAWKSLEKVNSFSLKSGDTISLKAGSRIITTQSISSKNNLTFNSYGIGERPIIDANDNHDCVNFDGSGKVSFTNLKFVNGYPSDVSLWNCNFISFEACNIDSSRGADIHHCNIYSGEGSFLTVRNSTLNYGEQGSDPNQGNLGIYIDGTDNTLIEYDTLIGNFSNVRVAFGTNNLDMANGLIVRYCVIRNGKYDNVDDDGSAGAQFYYNLFEAPNINIYLFTDGGGTYDSYATRNSSYFNNTFITHGNEASIHLNSKTGINNGMKFRNNIFYSDNSSGYFFYEEVSGQMGTWTLTNNLYFMTSPYSHGWYRNGNNYGSLSQWQSLGFDSSSIYSDPLFFNYAAGDYSLQNGSKAINTGAFVGLTIDVKGTNVPVAYPDLGTFQHKSTKLPVELTSFNGKYLDKSVNLFWSTASESNNQGFEIERKTNSSWNKIGYVAGNGNSLNKIEYSFEDKNISAESIQYRLKQIDYDGSFQYSEVINIIAAPTIFTIGNYPNPFNPSTKIRYSVPVESRINIIIYNILGEKIDELTNEIQQQGSFEINWSGNNHPSGIYLLSIVEISTNGNSSNSKTIKMNLIK